MNELTIMDQNPQLPLPLDPVEHPIQVSGLIVNVFNALRNSWDEEHELIPDLPTSDLLDKLSQSIRLGETFALVKDEFFSVVSGLQKRMSHFAWELDRRGELEDSASYFLKQNGEEYSMRTLRNYVSMWPLVDKAELEGMDLSIGFFTKAVSAVKMEHRWDLLVKAHDGHWQTKHLDQWGPELDYGESVSQMDAATMRTIADTAMQVFHNEVPRGVMRGALEHAQDEQWQDEHILVHLTLEKERIEQERRESSQDPTDELYNKLSHYIYCRRLMQEDEARIACTDLLEAIKNDLLTAQWD